MAFFLYLVGGLQAANGGWGIVDGDSQSSAHFLLNESYICLLAVWVITDRPSVTIGIIICSYLFVCSFAISMGPVSWTRVSILYFVLPACVDATWLSYPSEIFPMRVRAKAVSLSTAVCPRLSLCSYHALKSCEGKLDLQFCSCLRCPSRTCQHRLGNVHPLRIVRLPSFSGFPELIFVNPDSTSWPLSMYSSCTPRQPDEHLRRSKTSLEQVMSLQPGKSTRKSERRRLLMSRYLILDKFRTNFLTLSATESKWRGTRERIGGGARFSLNSISSRCIYSTMSLHAQPHKFAPLSPPSTRGFSELADL